MSSYRNTVEKFQQQAAGSLPCPLCKTPTLPKTLSNYGRCEPCFEAYCQQQQPQPARTVTA